MDVLICYMFVTIRPRVVKKLIYIAISTS